MGDDRKTNASRVSPTVSFSADAELRDWLYGQSIETGLSMGQVARFHLERARGMSEKDALVKQLAIGGFGDLRRRMNRALARVRTLLADALTVALSAPEELIEDEVARVMLDHVHKSDPTRGLPPAPPEHDDGLPSAGKRKRRRRGGKRREEA